MIKEGYNPQDKDKNLSQTKKNNKSKIVFKVEKNLKEINPKPELKNNIKEDYISTDSSPKKMYIISDTSKEKENEYLQINDKEPIINIHLQNSKKEKEEYSVVEINENSLEEKIINLNKNNEEEINLINDDNKNNEIVNLINPKKVLKAPLKKIIFKTANKNRIQKNKKNLEYILIEKKEDDSLWKSNESKINKEEFLNKKRKKEKEKAKEKLNNNNIKSPKFEVNCLKKLPERGIEKIKERVKEKEKKEENEKNNIIQNKEELNYKMNEKYLKDLITDLLEGNVQIIQKGKTEKSPQTEAKKENNDIKINTITKPEFKVDKNTEIKQNQIISSTNTINEDIKTDNLESKNTIFVNEDNNEKLPSNSSSNKDTSINLEETHEDPGMQTLLNLINNNGFEKIINYFYMDNPDKNDEIESKLNLLRKNYGDLKIIFMILKLFIFNTNEKYENNNNIKEAKEKNIEELKYKTKEENLEDKLESLEMKISKFIFSELGLETEIHEKNKNKNFIPKYFRDRIHSVVRMKGNMQRCYFCNKNKIDYFCDNCKVPIHLHCFKNYHNKFIYS